MPKSRFESFPRCCQKGHLVSLDYAQQIEAQNAAKRAKEAAKPASSEG